MPDQGETNQIVDTQNLSKGVTYAYKVALKNISGVSPYVSVDVVIR